MDYLIQAYFSNEVIKVFDSYFANLGARRESAHSSEIVRYSTDIWFAEILYLPLDGPRYSPRVEIGCKPEQFSDPRRNRVDVMHTMPEDSEEYYYNLLWRYQSPNELYAALVAVRDRIISVYLIRYLHNTNLLRDLLNRRNAIIETEWERQLSDHNDSVWRTKADIAFRSRNYAEVIQYYNNIPKERRSETDEVKLLYSKKNAREGQEKEV